MADLVAKWLNGEARGLKDYHGLVLRASTMTKYLNVPVSRSVDACEELVDDHMELERTPATINRKLAIVRRVLNLAFKVWHTPGVPSDIAGRIRLLPENNARHNYYPPEQVLALSKCVAKYRQEAGEMVLFASLTGLRKGEVLRLQPENVMETVTKVKEGRKEVEVVEAYLTLGVNNKTGKPRLIPLTAEARDIAKRRLPWSTSKQQLRDAWEPGRKDAGMEGVWFHDLRHTCASWLIQGGASLVHVRDWLGHANVQTTNRYAHLAAMHQLRAAAKLPQLSGSPVGQKKRRGSAGSDAKQAK